MDSVQDIFGLLPLTSKFSSLPAGRGSWRCSIPKFNVGIFLEFCFNAESRLVGETRSQKH